MTFDVSSDREFRERDLVSRPAMRQYCVSAFGTNVKFSQFERLGIDKSHLESIFRDQRN